MMFFTIENGAYVATNSIKPVQIRYLEEDCIELLMPEGDLTVPAKNLSVLFDTFGEAVKWAEHRVGVRVKFEAA